MEENTELLILKAAKKLFMDKGFAMTSTAEIAREAGCNTAMIHYYYRTKDKLFRAVFENEMANFSSGLALIPIQDISFEDKIKKMVGIHFEFLRANPKLPFLLINEFTTNPNRIDDFRTLLTERSGLVVELLEREIDAEVLKGSIRDVAAVDVVMNIISLNAMCFVALPLVERFAAGIDIECFLDQRKNEITNAVLGSFKKIEK